MWIKQDMAISYRAARAEEQACTDLPHRAQEQQAAAAATIPSLVMEWRAMVWRIRIRWLV